MRSSQTLFFLLLLLTIVLGVARAFAGDDVTFDSLSSDTTTRAALEEGIALAREYFKREAEVETGRSASAGKKIAASKAFRAWMDESLDAMGHDLRTLPGVVLEVFDRGRVDSLPTVKTGTIEYVSKATAGIRGGTFEYSVLVPRSYGPRKGERVPLVLALHGPAGDARPAEGSRRVIADHYEGNVLGDEYLVVAPKGPPDGFAYLSSASDDRPYYERQALFMALGEALTGYRSDWERVWLDVQGSVLRLLCEQAFVFTGFILRDREDDRQPFLPEEEAFMLENLNGSPLAYIADEKMWDSVGSVVSGWLEDAYDACGRKDSLLVLKVARDANGTLKANPAVLSAFMARYRTPKARKSFRWRFFNVNMSAPVPVEILHANYEYDVSEEAREQDLSDKAGSIRFAAKLASFRDATGATRPLNLIEIDITEAERLLVRLHDGLVNLDYPIRVVINGEIVHDKVKIERDWDSFDQAILPRRFFMLPFVGQLECEFERVPHFQPRPPEPPPMNPWFAKALVLIASVVMVLIRAPHGSRSMKVPVATSAKGRLEKALLTVAWVGFFVPIVWIASPAFSFADYPLRLPPLLAGAALLALGLWLFHLSHRDLGTNWSITLEVRERHELITGGLYRHVRHPMYLALLLYSLGQAIALPNWLAGPSYGVAFGILLALRLGPEERMMRERFGAEYVEYARRTKRLIPWIW